jgi:Ca2+-transporting ATPase
MITGDHPSTALAIAKRLGIAATEDCLITGAQLGKISDAELTGRIDRLRVFARMDPAQKIRIVRALQDTGEFVAMTGDGVNDAPALKQADIGISMGRNGTDVAREASDMILMDDNFATIVSAVAGGRRIYDNIRRFIRYILATNLAEVLLIFLAPFFGLPLPLLPVQILWINLVTDGLPGLALTAEKPEPDIMRRPPRPASESMFAGGLWQHLLWVGLVMSGLVLWVQQHALQIGAANWQTQVFTTMAFVQLANVMAIRSERSSTFTIGFCSNLPLLFSVILTVILQLALIYIPFLNTAFSTMPLSPGELLLCASTAVIIFIGVETEKWMIRRGWLYSRMAPPHTESSHD